MDLDAYRDLADELDAGAFASTFPYGFLVHRPSAASVLVAPPLADSTEQYSDRTGLIRAAVLAADESWDTVDAEFDAPPGAGDWCIAAINYRVSGPSGGLISVGRVRLCDVVLRFEAVSKQHAHFVVGPRGLTHVRDDRSTHGTFVNGVRVAPDTQAPLHPRDRLAFGAIEFEWLDAESTRTLLRQR